MEIGKQPENVWVSAIRNHVKHQPRAPTITLYHLRLPYAIYIYDSPEVLLDLNLPPDLFLHLVLQDLRLDQAFQGDDVPRRGLCPRQVDSTEFPTSEGFADLEI
jgi:hypothetical protein